MSFKSLAPYKLARSDGKASIAVQKRQVAIRLGPVILEKLGWGPGTTVDVQVGEGDDYGVVRLARHKLGWSLQKQGGKHGRDVYVVLRIQKLILNKPCLPQVPDRLSFTPIDAKIVGDEIEFRLPWIATFAAENIPFRPNGINRLIRPETHVATEASS